MGVVGQGVQLSEGHSDQAPYDQRDGRALPHDNEGDV